jgi:hypothetical protein
MREVLEHFAQAEWHNDWDAGVAEWGDGMRPALMARTDAQRRFDALLAVFNAAAGSTASGGAITVNLVVDQATYEHHLQRTLGGSPEPLPPSTAANRRCEDHRGTVIDPRAVVAASLVGHVRRMVLDAAGVVVDMGRRQRLFTGALREAVLLSSRRCLWPGCNRAAQHCDADHLTPASQQGTTDTHNGGPNCSLHNGSEVGWRTQHLRLAA